MCYMSSMCHSLEIVSMLEFKTKLGQNGRLLIPAECRQAMNLSVNDEIVILVEDGEATFFTLEHAVKRAQTIMKKYMKKGEKLSEQLIADRRKEGKHE